MGINSRIENDLSFENKYKIKRIRLEIMILTDDVSLSMSNGSFISTSIFLKKKDIQQCLQDLADVGNSPIESADKDVTYTTYHIQPNHAS